MALLPLLALVGMLTRQAAPPQWPEQLDNPKWRPHIGYMRPDTAIAGQPLFGPKLLWHGQDRQPQWSLINEPAGMKIDALHRIMWPDAVEGRYLVRVQAKFADQTEVADYYLNVLKTEFPGAVVYATRHMDYIVPPAYAAWMDSSGAGKIVDAYYEFGRDLVGGLPSDARQSMIYTLSIGGAHSGDPIVSGPGTFGDNDVNRWKLGYLFHELGHDLNAWTRVDVLQRNDGIVDSCLHGMVEFDKIAWVTRMLKSPDRYALSDVSKFTEWMRAESMEFVDGYLKYMKDVPKGLDLMHAQGQSGIWAGMIHEYAFTYGAEPLEKVIRAIRRDGFPLKKYLKPNASSADRMTALMCIMSNAAGQDLRSSFHAMNMPLNDVLWDHMNSAVAKQMANLPAVGINGALQCPVDKRYYCLIPYPTSWAIAESIARRMGGHLATIRSEAQEGWLSNKWANDGWLWIGCRRDNQSKSWNWVTGETTNLPIWEPGRPEADPAKTCGVLIFHDDEDNPWFGLANRPPDENHFGIMEFDHPPAVDVDDLP